MDKAAIFLLFVALALAAARRSASRDRRRARASRLLLYGTVVSLLVGVTGHEAWPFSAWPMDNVLMPEPFGYLAPVVVDARGRESPLDPRALEPIPWVDLSTWLARWQPIDADVAASVGPYLLNTVRAARRRAAAGHDVGTYRRYLGWLAAPNTQLSPDRWSPDAPPPDSIVALRVYEYEVLLDGPVLQAERLPRRIVFAYPR